MEHLSPPKAEHVPSLPEAGILFLGMGGRGEAEGTAGILVLMHFRGSFLGEEEEHVWGVRMKQFGVGVSISKPWDHFSLMKPFYPTEQPRLGRTGYLGIAGGS